MDRLYLVRVAHRRLIAFRFIDGELKLN